jgi:alginate O-acetyltransferase complex protein AlgJ
MLELPRRALPVLPFGLATTASAQSPSVIRGRDGWLFFAWDDPARADLSRLPRVTGIVRDAAAELERAGIRCAALVIPSKFRIYRDKLPPGAVIAPEAERRYAAALQALRGGVASAPDVSAALLERRRASPEQEVFFRGDTHWTPTGAAVAAHLLGRDIAGQLPPARHAGVRLGPVVTETRVRRDLVELLPAGERPSHPPEAFTVRRPVEASGRNALLDSVPSDVAVIGNSYMHPDFNFINEFSASLNRPVALHWRVQHYGPFRTLLEYLEGPVFRAERPRYLVWTFLEGTLTIPPENRGAYPEHNMTGDAFLEAVRRALAARPRR